MVHCVHEKFGRSRITQCTIKMLKTRKVTKAVTYRLSCPNSSSNCSIKLASSSTDSLSGSLHDSRWSHSRPWGRAEVARRSAWRLVPQWATRAWELGPAHSLELCDFINDRTSWKFADNEWLRPVDCNTITDNTNARVRKPFLTSC